ncbi:MAG: IS3 family transposase [Pseudomonadota bacterium]
MVRQGEQLEPDEGFRFVKANQADHPVAVMCRVLDLSRSGFYAWCEREPSAHDLRDEVLLVAIREEHLASMGIYGAPRIHERLRRRGYFVSRKRVARLMREAGLSGVTRRKKWRTTKRDQQARRAPDLVNRAFEADGPNQLWVADITHVSTRSGPLYLAMLLDVWSRKVFGWAIDTTMPAELVVRAVDMALERRRPQRVIHHSDQGSQYTVSSA